jgi:hypothetical protein
MSDVDTMRWGDTQVIKLASAVESVQTGSQMLNAHWQRPCVWRLLISVAPSVGIDDQGITIGVVPSLRIGVGQANQLVPLPPIVFAPGAYAPVTQFFDVPAENLQLQFQVTVTGVIVDTSDNVTVSAFVAPRAEPGGIVQIRDGMGDGIREPDRDGLARWPGRGFEDGELTYRPR